MKKFILAAIVLAAATGAQAAPKIYSLKSPDGNIEIAINPGDTLSFSVAADGGVPVEQVKTVMLFADGRQWGINAKVGSARRSSYCDTIRPVVPMKFSKIPNCYNALTLKCRGGYAVEFRAFNDGIAYRYVADGKSSGQVDVADEIFIAQFAPEAYAHLQTAGSFKTSYEETYIHQPIEEFAAADRMATLPAFVKTAPETYVLMCETDLADYPAMFLRGNGNGTVKGVFPKVPLTFGYDGDRSVKIETEADYIARTSADRNFPWRYMAIGSPADIYTQTLSARLAQPSVIADTSWIKPGVASWEWWNGAIPYGPDVNFEAGCNLDTYKYFIDFASKYGIPYIVMDEGWAKSTTDPYTPNPQVDLHEIIRYGNEKGVGVFLWLTWLAVENNFDKLFSTMSDWGVKGLKIDFMDRSDQWMVNFYERVIKEAAANNILVDFHGAFKPSGLEVKYPNLLAYEGVRGMEMMGSCTPDNSLYYPFIRNAVGPMDYTPGAMISMQPESYSSRRPNSASIGTRAYQLALFPLFETGLQMIADNPTLYYRNDDCTRFIADVPHVWDETRLIEADPGQYIVAAKRNGDRWWITAICNGEGPRNFKIPTDFLTDGITYDIEWFEDGPNANRQAMDYRRKTGTATNSSVFDAHLARNGGWTAVLTPRK